MEYKGIVIGCDHAAVDMKNILVDHCAGKNLAVCDLTPGKPEDVIFADTAFAVVRKTLQTPATLGVLLCGTGVGMSIAANRLATARAAILYDDFVAEYAARHNDANIIVFGARTMQAQGILRRFDIFLSHTFEGGKYALRNSRIDKLASEVKNVQSE